MKYYTVIKKITEEYANCKDTNCKVIRLYHFYKVSNSEKQAILDYFNEINQVRSYKYYLEGYPRFTGLRFGRFRIEFCMSKYVQDKYRSEQVLNRIMKRNNLKSFEEAYNFNEKLDYPELI